MNRQISLLTIALVCLLNLSACGKRSFFEAKDNSEPPAKLTSIKEKIDVRRVWQEDAGGGVGKLTLRLNAALSGGQVFVADYRGRLSAYTLDKGRRVWSVETKKPLSAGPTVANGKVIVASSEGDVLAHDAKTGKQLWKVRVTSEVLSAPSISNSIVVIRSIDGVLTGLNINTGGVLWHYRRRAPKLTIRGSSQPAIVGDLIYAGFDNGKIACIRAFNGRVVWERTVSPVRGRTEIERLNDIDADPLVHDGTMYVATYQGKLAAFNLTDVQLLWTRKMSSTKSMAIDSQNIYLTDDHSQVWAFNRQTGVSLWKQSGLRARKMTGPAVIGDYVVVGDFQGYLHWLDRRTGEIVGRYRGDSKGYIEAPITVGDRLIVYGKSGELAVLRYKELKK